MPAGKQWLETWLGWKNSENISQYQCSALLVFSIIYFLDCTFSMIRLCCTQSGMSSRSALFFNLVSSIFGLAGQNIIVYDSDHRWLSSYSTCFSEENTKRKITIPVFSYEDYSRTCELVFMSFKTVM